MTVAEWAAAWAQSAGNPRTRARIREHARAATEAGIAAGGLSCCGTTGEWHQPWCYLEPKDHGNA